MESPEDIEKALAALVPSAISERGQRSLEELIDSLAAGETPVAELPEPASAPAPVAAPPRRSWAWVGAAGAAAAVVMAFQMPGGDTRLQQAQSSPAPAPAAAEPEVISLGKSEFVDSAEPGDWVSEKDGVLHRVVHIRYVNKERLRDVKTGLEIVVTEASEDLGWSPVASF